MIRLSGTVLALTAWAVLVDVAVAGDTHMVVPSRSTAAQLEALSYKSNVVADVLTVDRKDYVLTLDGSGGGAFSGEGVSGESADPGAARSAIRIPLEQMALVYYVEVPADKKNDTSRYPAWRSYPSIAAIGAAERTMDCSELDTEIARAGTIRWYARRHGVVPFTEHEARVQHGKNAAKDIGIGLLVVMALAASAGPGYTAGGGAGGAGLFGGGNTMASPIDQETFRWAATAADRREIGLLQLKRERSCPGGVTPSGETTDLEILTAVESTRGALDSHQISDVDQRDQQTQLLDRLDPPASLTMRVALGSAAREPAVVIFRLAAEVNSELLEAPFNVHLNHHKVNFFIRLRDLALSGSGANPKAGGGRALPTSPSNDDDRKAGWAYLTLAPGQYDLQFEWLAEGLTKWGQTRAAEFSVGAGATAIYIGTVTFTCTDKTNAFAAHRSCEAPKVIDESSAASAVVQHSLAQYAPPTTSLASIAELSH